MRTDTTSLEQKEENLRLLINQVVDDACNGEAFNYNKMFNMFEQLKIVISENRKAKKDDKNVRLIYTSEINVVIE